MFNAIKTFLTSQYVTNSSPLNGIGQFLYELVINFFKLLEFVPDLFALLPWYVIELIFVFLAWKIVPAIVNLVWWIKKCIESLCDSLTRGKFRL